MSQNTILDLSSLPAPDAIETLSFESIYDDLVADFMTRWEAKRALKPDLPEINVLGLETDPLATVFQAWAYREVLWRSRVNSAFRSNLLAFSTGADLDHIGANYGVGRMVATPATDNEPAVMESDERYRRRINLGIYAYSTAGSIEAYQFHVLTADPTILDVSIDNPKSNRVDVTVLSAIGDGTPNADQMDRAADALSPTKARPLTDDVRLRPATIINQPISFRIVIPRGPAPEPIRLLAIQKVKAYAEERHRIGKVLWRDGIIGAARAAGGMEQVILDSPAADVAPGIAGAVYVPTITATTEILS